MRTMHSEMTAATAVRVAVRTRSGSSVKFAALSLLGFVVTISGCGYDTAIYGMYFPSWVVAPVLGAGASGLSLSFVARTRLAPYVSSGIVVFGALTLIYAVLFWALFFVA